MEMFLVVIGVFFLGVFLGWYAHAKAMFVKMVTDPDSIIALLQKLKDMPDDSTEPTQKTVKIEKDYRIEWHHDVCYLYDSKDNFLAQGETIIEAMDRAERRFPGMKLDFRVTLPNESAQ